MLRFAAANDQWAHTVLRAADEPRREGAVTETAVLSDTATRATATLPSAAGDNAGTLQCTTTAALCGAATTSNVHDKR